MDAARTRSWVPSFDPPSALMITERCRGKYFSRPARMACTTCPTVLASLKVGTPMRMSTSPTFINSRRKSSVRMLPSAKPILHYFSDLSQAKPVELVRAQGQQIRQVTYAGENIPAKHFDQDVAFVATQIELHRLGGTRQIIHHQNRVLPQLSCIRQHPMVRRIQEVD